MTAPRSSGESRTAAGYKLGDLVVDLRTRAVLRDGTDLGVTRLSFDLLVALARAAPGLVRFDDLMAQVWPGLVVSPETLTQRVKLLRQALGESADDPRYVVAVRGVGYRLRVPAEPLSAIEAAPTADAATSAAPAAGPRDGAAQLPGLLIGALAITALAVGVWWLTASTPAVDAATKAEADRYFRQAESVVNGTPESFQAAVSLYGEALALDPELAPALSGRAMNRAALVWVGSPLARGLDDAQADAEAALRLDPREARAHSVLASIHALRGQWLAAGERFEAALALSPHDAETRSRLAASLLLPTGRLEQAAAAANEALRLAPGTGFSESVLAFVEQARGRDAEAILLAAEALVHGADRRQMEAVLATASARQGRFAAAAEHAIQSLPAVVRQAGADQALRTAFGALGNSTQQDAALGVLRRLVRNPAWDSADPRSRQPVLYLFAAFGALDDLHGELQRLVRDGAGGDAQIIAIASLWSPEMSAYRRDVRFHALAERLNLSDYWRRTAPPDACRFEGPTLACD